MEAKAILRHLRMPAKKVRMITKALKKDTVSSALLKLKFLNKNAAPHIAKAIKSAAANASKNNGADPESLKIKGIIVQQGPILKYAKRFMPRAQGRASAIHKRSCHILVTVTDEKK